MAPSKLPGQPIRIKANELNKAVRAGEMLDQLQGLGVAPDGVINSALPLLIRNGHTTDLPAYGLTRWAGEALTPAAIGGNVPALILKTAATNTTHPIGVVPDYVQAAASGVPAGIGRVQIVGATWARCRGAIVAGDKLIPDSAFRGIKDTNGTSNVTALAAVAGSGTDAIIPVRIDPLSANSCVKKYQLFIIGSVASGSFPLPVQVPDGSGGWVTENVTINYNSTTAQTKTAIEGHSLIDPDTVVVTGSSNLVSANHVIIMPSDTRLGSGGDAELDSSALVRSGIIQPKVYLLECCS